MSHLPPQPSPGSPRARLDAERAEVLARLAAMRVDFEGIVAASLDSNADDEHDPEGATIAYERSQLDALMTQARRHLDEIEDAVLRDAAGRYGVCEQCARAIAAARLEARPAARLCVDCASSAGR